MLNKREEGGEVRSERGGARGERKANTRKEVVLADPWRDPLEHKVAG